MQRFDEEHGTTSACAENTTFYYTHSIMEWNYLRVRGEYVVAVGAEHGDEELPPRARRIQQRIRIFQDAFGTTSACAENTAGCARGGSGGRNYLRVRGEY